MQGDGGETFRMLYFRTLMLSCLDLKSVDSSPIFELLRRKFGSSSEWIREIALSPPHLDLNISTLKTILRLFFAKSAPSNLQLPCRASAAIEPYSEYGIRPTYADLPILWFRHRVGFRYIRLFLASCDLSRFEENSRRYIGAS